MTSIIAFIFRWVPWQLSSIALISFSQKLATVLDLFATPSLSSASSTSPRRWSDSLPMFFAQFECSVCPDFGVRISEKNTDNGQVFQWLRYLWFVFQGWILWKDEKLYFLIRKSNLVSVVTGCTRGIGQVYVDELAQRKLDIVLIGRSLPVLKEMAAKVGKLFFYS